MEWKVLAGALIAKTGFRVYKVGTREKLNWCPPHEYRTYSPWFEKWFLEIFDRGGQNMYVKEDRCYVLHQLCRHCLHMKGSVAECGVYKGGTAFILGYTIANCDGSGSSARRLHLFDTFAGMPAIANRDPSGVKEGWLSDTTLEAVRATLRDFPFITYHPGFIPETFGGVESEEYVFVHIDVDLYQTTLDCCEFFYERMVAGGVIVFDDYGFYPFTLSQKKAVDEFFSDKPEVPIVLQTGQCIVIKL